MPSDKAKNGRPSAYDESIAGKIIDGVRTGLTLERAAELVGMNPGTVQGWTTKRPDFGRRVKKARREHEVSLLQSIEAAGERSWQAKAWILERAHGYAQPSSRLSVDTSVTHNAGQGFAQLLAGLASRRAEKKAKVIELSSANFTEGTKYNTNCTTLATNANHHKPLAINNKSNYTKIEGQTFSKLRNKPMRRRRPRRESLAKYPLHDTPTPTPPATDSIRITPLNNCDTKQKEDHAQETSQGSAEGS